MRPDTLRSRVAIARCDRSNSNMQRKPEIATNSREKIPVLRIGPGGWHAMVVRGQVSFAPLGRAVG
jgi:hypothetical protein